ncbi:protein YgfX [Luteibacter sp. NPDC031894]|jgi:hypothetical protein|uniref:protein YgfX n=1 Tax=Luteibacter sp. NPDC031894 TaxID=3390572 RepID=UPI003D00D352
MTSERGIGSEPADAGSQAARGIHVVVHPSKTLTILVASVLVLATVAPLLTSLPWATRYPLAVVAGCHGLLRLRAFRRSPVAAFRLSSAAFWTVTQRNGRDIRAELAGSRVFGPAVFLHLRWRGGAGQVALLPDNTPADELRLLRARLRTRTA